MSSIMKIIRWLLIIVIPVAVLALATYFLDWTPSVVIISTVATVLGVAVLWLGIRFVKKRAHANAVAASQKQTDGQKQRLERLENLWKTAIARIKRSKLKEKGNPIYVLPWYLLLGDTQSGKTSAIKNSRVAIPLVEGGAAPQKGERLGNWWLMDEALVIDTPGRYTFPVDDSDEAEWQKFKSLFTKYRKWQPVNGVIVSISADRLMRNRDDELKSFAAQIRNRLADLVQSFGVKFPVYIMVTKSDLIAGMSRFFDQFPDQVVMQAMGGLVSASPGARVADQLDHIMESIEAKLQELRLSLLVNVEPSELTAPAYILPEEITAMHASIRTFAHAMLDNSFFNEAPTFRGLYFTSGRQEGRPLSNVLPLQYESELSASQRVGERSLFLKGFFGRVLKNDRDLVTPTAQALYIKKIRQNLGVSSWVAACVVVGVVLSFAFFHNLNTMGQVTEHLPADIVLKKDINEDLKTLDDFRRALVSMHEKNESRWLPTLGLRQSRNTEAQLAVVYGNKFREAVLVPFDKQFTLSANGLAADATPNELAAYIDFMTKRIKLHQAVLAGDVGVNDLYELDQPDYQFMLKPFGAGSQKGILEETLKDNYLAYLTWVDNERLLRADLGKEEERLSSLLAKNGIGLNWLTAWANMQDQFEDVNLRTYWGAVPTSGDETKVPRAYTPAGWTAINEFLGEIQKAVSDKESLEKKQQIFVAEYEREYFNAWRDFLRAFDKGETGWMGRDRRIELASKLAGVESPYTKILGDTVKSLQPVLELSVNEQDAPEWVSLVYRLDKLSDANYQQVLEGSDGLVGKLANKSGKVLGKFKRVLRGMDDNESVMVADKKALPLLKNYQVSLKHMAQQTQSPQASYQLAKDVFIEADASVGEPKQDMNKNHWSLARLKEIIGSGAANEDVVWNLLAKQSIQVWDVLLSESEVYLEQAWQTEVLASATGLAGWQKIEELQGPNGKIWAFQKDFIGPFLKKTSKGYASRELYNSSLDVVDNLYTVLNRGKVSQNAISGSYRVEVSALPTDTNPDAQVKPHLTKLTIVCGSGSPELSNYNYPVRKTLVWSPQDCGDVILEIHVGDISVEKRYEGFNGFVSFLKDFRTGRRVFGRKDFETNSSQLAAYGIKTISVAYKFGGQDSVMNLALKDPSAIPETIMGKRNSTHYAGND